MKLLHIMASRGLGGAEIASTDVMLGLHASGIDQCVVMPKNAPRYQELKEAGIRLAPDVLATPFRFLQRRRLQALIAQEKPDVIHCWLRRAANLLPQSDNPLARAVIGWFGGYYDVKKFKGCTHFVGVTKDIVAHQIKSGIDAAKAFFIPTFPDIRDMQPVVRQALKTSPHDKVLLTLSRLHSKKGLDTFLMALQIMPDCVAWIAGDGPLQRNLEKLARKLGVYDRVRFLGWRTDRAALLRAADVCVLPSRYEPFGTVILEAWAAGTPLVACASAGPAAHVIDGVNGLLVPVDDAAGLAKAIKCVLDDGNLRRQLISEGHNTYVQDYTPEAVMQKWRQLYEQLATGAA